MGEIGGLLLKVLRRANVERRSRIVGLVEGGLLSPGVTMRGWLSNLGLERPREELESLTCTALTSFVDVLGEELMLSPRTFDSSAAGDTRGTDSSGSPEGGGGGPRSASRGAGGVFGAENQPRTWFIESERRSTQRKSERVQEERRKERQLEARVNWHFRCGEPDERPLTQPLTFGSRILVIDNLVCLGWTPPFRGNNHMPFFSSLCQYVSCPTRAPKS